MRITAPIQQSDFVSTHPLAFKSHTEYYDSYCRPVTRALQSLGVELVVSPKSQVKDFEVLFEFDDGKSSRCLFDYADVMEMDVDTSSFDAAFKMKCHPKRVGAERIDGRASRYLYPGSPCPIYPGGFSLAVGAGCADTPRWLEMKLPKLRTMKDGEQLPDYYAQFGFRICQIDLPQRTSLSQLNRWGNRRIPVDAYHENIAKNLIFLNLCGNNNSVDRKVIEACAIGVAMVSTSGLKDWVMPHGYKLRSGKDCLFADTIEEIQAAFAEIRNTFFFAKDLVLNTRWLYEHVLCPDALGQWYLECAREVAK